MRVVWGPYGATSSVRTSSRQESRRRRNNEWNFPNLEKETRPGSTVSNKRNPERPPARHGVIKMAKIKDKHSLEGLEGENSELHRASSCFTSQRQCWKKGTENIPPVFRIEGESFPDKQTLNEFITKLALQEMLQGLYAEKAVPKIKYRERNITGKGRYRSNRVNRPLTKLRLKTKKWNYNNQELHTAKRSKIRHSKQCGGEVKKCAPRMHLNLKRLSA